MDELKPLNTKPNTMPNHNLFAIIAAFQICFAAVSPCRLFAQLNDIGKSATTFDSSKSLPNVPFPTFGGKQFWTDHVWRNDWRIQQNEVTGHWRLIDPENYRQAWGSRNACQSALDRLVRQDTVQSKRVVLLVHGLFRTSSCMSDLSNTFANETKLRPVRFEYASTRNDLAMHAAALRDVIASLPGDCEINFVAHSMGNIVIRRAIYDWQQADDQATLARIRSFVMLGPPNQGAAIARSLGKTGVFGVVAGEGAMQLGRDWESIEAALATPHCPFGIIAGRIDETRLRNPLVNEGSDFIVSVAETQLDGATDSLEVPVLHSSLMDDRDVQQAVLHFIDHHRFPSSAHQ